MGFYKLTNKYVKSYLTKRSKIRKMFHSIVDETVKLTKKQAHSYNNMSLSLVNRKEEDLLIKRSEFYQLELVNQIGFEELYKSIFVGLENSVSNIFL